MSVLPRVTVIVPAYNAGEQIKLLIESLLNVDYPEELLEIIIIDNGSTDDTKEIIRKYPVTLLTEDRIQSSYAARNMGVAHARHEVLAFTDSDCVVKPDWIHKGVRAMARADLVAGRIEFVFSPQPTAAELYDAMVHMQNDYLLDAYSGAATANLFVKASIFKDIGMFRDDVQSGGDMMWTRLAKSSGYTIIYVPEVVVSHPTRRMKELFRKGFRLGAGTYGIYRSEGISRTKMLLQSLRSLFPPRLEPTRDLILQRGTDLHKGRTGAIWWVSYLCRVGRGLGCIYAILGLSTTGSNRRSS